MNNIVLKPKSNLAVKMLETEHNATEGRAGKKVGVKLEEHQLPTGGGSCLMVGRKIGREKGEYV